MRKIYSLAIMLMASIMSFAQANFTQAALTPGNLVIYRIGDGAAALGNTGTAIFLDEYTTAGVFVQSIPVPTTTVGLNRRAVGVGNATTEGLLTRSSDGQYIVFPGYDAALGATGLATSTSAVAPRVIGRLDNTGALNTTTALTDAISGGNPRSATSTNGTDLWISGTSSGGGIRYATLGATTSVSLTATPTNLRGTAVYGGQLYVSSQSGAFRLATVGTGTPTTSGQTTTNLPGFPTATGSPYQFFFADVDAGIAGNDVVYVADDGGTIQKYSLVAGSWTANGTLAASGVRGITGTVSGTTVSLFYAYNTTKLGTLTDASGYNATITGTPTEIATAPTNTAFRGVALAPVASATPTLTVTPSTLSGFSSQAGTPSANQTFSVDGNNLTPSGATITVTSNSPIDIEVSPTGLAGSFGSSFTFNAVGTTVTAVPVYVRLTGTNQGSISGTVTVSGGGATPQNVTINGSVVRTYYSQSTGSLAVNTNWGANPDGTGSQPNNFTNDGQVFVVTNRVTTTLDANWTVSGASSKVVVGNGITATELVIPAGFTLTGITDVANLGKLNLQNTTLPTFGNLATGSTVEYAQVSPVSILNTTADAVNYYNLILSNFGIKTFKGNTTTVNGNLTYDGSTNGPLTVESASASPFATINLNGDLTYTGTVTNPADANSYTLNMTNTGTQTITGGGNTARFFRLTAANAGNNIVLSALLGGTPLTLGNASGGGLTLNTGTTLELSGNNVTFFAGATTSVTGAGTITGSTASNMTINKAGSTAFGTLLFTTGAEQLNGLTINTTATTTPTVTLGTKLDLSGTLTLTAGKLVLGANTLSTPTVSGGSSTAYVVTNGAGALKINNVGSAPITYPVGPSITLYHPATISNTGTIDNFAVKVASTAPPCADPNYSVTATWDIAEDVAGGSSCTLSLDYTGAANGGAYNSSTARIIHCTGATADYSNGAVVGSTATGTGFTNFSPFGISMDPIVIPVRIVNLRGTAEGKFNRLSWTSLQENANSGFEIQRSEDGHNFDAIGFEQSAAPGGNSGIELNYTFDDHKAGGTKLYYRLRQVDLNGQSRLTNTVLINGAITAITGIEGVYPNPALDKLNVSVISQSHDRVTLTVTDLSGKKMSQQSYTAEAGKNILPLNVAKLASGTYIIQLLGSKNVSTIKFIKE